jgi:hypothetical protein
MSSGFEYADALVLRCIYIDRNAVHSSQGLREDVPSALVLRKIQKVCFPVHFELHFQSPWVRKSKPRIFTAFRSALICANPWPI